MKISSMAFSENSKIPKIYSRLGGNKRPPLKIENVPQGSKSLAIICHDPDAPGQDGFYHWTAWDLPASTTLISDSLPSGAVEGITSWGKPGYGGPQPPFGTHRYQFHVYALDTNLDLPADTKPKELEKIISGHIIDHDVLTGRFGALDILRRS